MAAPHFTLPVHCFFIEVSAPSVTIFLKIWAERCYMVILKLDDHNEQKEIAFELEYLASLTTRQRFEMMFQKTQEMLSLLKRKDANRKTTEIIKRT